MVILIGTKPCLHGLGKRQTLQHFLPILTPMLNSSYMCKKFQFCVCACVCTYICIVCVCVYMYVCVYACIYVYTHKYPNVPLQSLRTYTWWNSKDAAIMGLNLTWDQMAPVGEQSSESHAGCPRKSRISGNKKYVHCTVCMRAHVCACVFVRACM